MNNQNQSKFSQGISTPIGILIIVICVLLVGGILTWQYKLLVKEKTEISEVKLSEVPVHFSIINQLDQELRLKIELNGKTIYNAPIPVVREYPKLAAFPTIKIGKATHTLKVTVLFTGTSNSKSVNIDKEKYIVIFIDKDEVGIDIFDEQPLFE